MKKFELPEQPQKTNTSNDFTAAKEAIANLDKFDYAWKTYSHKLEKRFIAAIKYIGELERENQRLIAENLSVKTLVEDAKKQQPEIPEITKKQAEILNDYKNGSGSLAKYLTTEIKKRDYDYFAQAWLNGYTVAKEKQFYLKDNRELESVGNTCIGYVTLYLKNDGYLTTDKTRAGKFTQQEIDSMETGSYEQIEVEE